MSLFRMLNEWWINLSYLWFEKVLKLHSELQTHYKSAIFGDKCVKLNIWLDFDSSKIMWIINGIKDTFK